MLYGKYVLNGTINLEKTVVELGLQEKIPFLPIEEQATLEHLMAARSESICRRERGQKDDSRSGVRSTRGRNSFITTGTSTLRARRLKS